MVMCVPEDGWTIEATAERFQVGRRGRIARRRGAVSARRFLFTVGQIVPYWLGRTVLLEVAAAKRRTQDAVKEELGKQPPPIAHESTEVVDEHRRHGHT